MLCQQVGQWMGTWRRPELKKRMLVPIASVFPVLCVLAGNLSRGKGNRATVYRGFAGWTAAHAHSHRLDGIGNFT